MSESDDQSITADDNDVFQDPSVQQMTKKPTNIQEGLDDYNPFADPVQQQRPGTVSTRK